MTAYNGEYLTAEETAQRLRTTVQNLYQWRKKGVIKTYRTPGGKPVFKKEDVEKLCNPTEDI